MTHEQTTFRQEHRHRSWDLLLLAVLLASFAGCSGNAKSTLEATSAEPQERSASNLPRQELSETASAKRAQTETKAASNTTWEDQVRQITWIGYFPSTADPEKKIEARPEEMLRDLTLLRRAGFTGLVTYTAAGNQGLLLTKIAKTLGFEGIIVGVWDCNNPDELAAAQSCASSDIVLGYCVGNEGYKKRYTASELRAAITRLRESTGRKVATTEEIDDYSDPELLDLGDWLFPNAHPYFHSQIEPGRAADWTKYAYEDLAGRTKRFVWFKEVGLPTAGSEKVSEQGQMDYYRQLAKTDVFFSYFEGFDLPWKDHLPIEPHWGLFRSDRSAKPLAARRLEEHADVEIPEPSPALLAALGIESEPNQDSPRSGKTPMLTPDGTVSVDRSYVASGVIGDVGDVLIGSGENGATRFTYTPRSQGPHEWDYKYLDGKLNEEPAKQGGVVWLSPANDWGDSPNAGYDLRELKPNTIKWEARASGERFNVRFFLGGVTWKWDKGAFGSWVQTPLPHGDSVPWVQLGAKQLSTEWQEFEARLDDRSFDFHRLVGGFGWLMTWEDNAVSDGEAVKSYPFEVRNIRYLHTPEDRSSHDKPFYVYQDADSTNNHFAPSGLMGDCGDIRSELTWTRNPHAGKSCIRVAYEAKGKGPNKCDYPGPCRWAGCYWQNPPNNWGTNEFWKGQGLDLSAYKRCKFWARAERSCRIDFFVGGLNESFGDSLKYPRKKQFSLTTEWTEHELDLSSADLSHIIGGFGWVTNWDENPNGATFYLDDIRFEK